MIISLFYNELVKVLYKRRTYISFILITLLIPLIVYGFQYGALSLEQKLDSQMQDVFITTGSAINGYLASYIIISILISQMSFLSTIVPSEIISGEYSKGTFRMYLTRPISRSKLFLSKAIVVLLYTSIMMFYFFGYTILVSYAVLDSGLLIVFHDGLLGLDPNADNVIFRFFIGFFFSNLIMITVSLLCLMFSSFSKNSVTPIISTISIVFIGAAILFIPIDIFEFINPYIFTGYMDIFLKAFYKPIPYDVLKDCFIVCCVWSILFLLIAYFNFLQRDMVE